MNTDSIYPKIRFPEFRDLESWSTIRLEDCLLQAPDYGLNVPAVPYSDKLPTYLRITDIADDGTFISKNKMSVNAELSENNSLHDGDIVLARTGASVGKAYKYRPQDGTLIFAGFLIRIRPNQQILRSEYIYQYLFTSSYKNWVQITSARSGQPGINSKEYSSLLVPHTSLTEQQKIADCLLSLDKYIDATKRKLELLKEHKKGLMQRLFPTKGKTVPELRFPEFQNDKEWDYENGNELYDSIVNKDHYSDLPILAITQENGAVPRDDINYRVIVEKKSIEGYKVVEVGDFIISLRSFQGGIEYSRYRGLCSPAYIVLRKKHNEICDDFYRHYFKSFQYIQELNRNLEGIRDGKMVSYKQFSDIKIPHPSFTEQKMVADCLSSLDDTIKSCEDKISALELHKKGLMQQIFPKL